MSGKSKIEWTQHTWNPIVGCSIVSPGCTNCYAMAMAARIEAMGNQPRYAGTTKRVNGNAVWTGKLALAPDSALLAPLKRKAPTTYFVNSMGDLFHEDCPDEWIDRVFAVMALCPQHTFQVLTKRAERMRQYMTARERMGTLIWSAADFVACQQQLSEWHPAYEYLARGKTVAPWPLPNVWLGVSCERQEEADERIPHLLQTPAAVRFVSAEPLLGPIDLTRVRAPVDPTEPEAIWLFDSLSTGDMYEQRYDDPFGSPRYDTGDGPYREHKIDWIIAGGESGPKARPMHPDWARGLRDQCQAAGVAFFFKQWGEWGPDDFSNRPVRCGWLSPDGTLLDDVLDVQKSNCAKPVWLTFRLGKKTAGRLLDGVEHNAFPIAADVCESTAARILGNRARQQGAFD